MKHNFTVRHGALDGIEAFLSVAGHRSFRRAAADLGVSPSAVSQSIRALEARVGAALFVRTTRSVGLTEAGQRFLSRAKPAFEELVVASQVARDMGRRPSGLLRLTVPRSVIPVLLEPLIASFCKAFPDVQVEVAPSEELLDLAAHGFDAGVRMGEFIAPDMVAVRMTRSFPLIVVASPDYLKSHDAPTRVADLREHACLRIRRSSGAIAPWSFVEGNKTIEAVVEGPLIAKDYPTLLGGALQGMGLAQVPEPIALAALKERKLRRVLETSQSQTAGVFLYYSNRQKIAPKLRAFIDHVKYRPPAKSLKNTITR